MVKSDKDCLILFIIQTSEFEKNRGVLEKIQMLIVEYVNYIGLIVLEVTFWEETGMKVQHTHPEKFLTGFDGRGCDGEIIYKEYSNPERLLGYDFRRTIYMFGG